MSESAPPTSESAPPTSEAAVPTFAVVGRVNKGKSSLVATLSEDDGVRVGPRPGTTVDVREFPVRVDGEVVFVLVDTPGFEEAALALAWLRERETSAASRPELVARLVAEHEGTDDFVEERRLLRPILDGACVLYVVDGSRPYRPNYDAEMEILRWTGQPRMALINKTAGGHPAANGGQPAPAGVQPEASGGVPVAAGRESHVAEWRRALEQYFSIVRELDAHEATFDQRIGLLETFRELQPAWRKGIDRAIEAMTGERGRRQAESADILTDLLVDALTFTVEVRIPEGEEPKAHARRLEERFHGALREREKAARSAIEALYGHRKMTWEEADLARPAFDEDLFAEATWKRFGLTPGQLLWVTSTAGAAVGGTFDAAVGAASFFAGAVVGGLAGLGVGLYQLRDRFAAAASVKGALEVASGGRPWRVGPHAHPNFPWVVLDRALAHHAAVSARAHARRDVAIAPAGVGEVDSALPASRLSVSALPKERRAELERLFRGLRSSGGDPAAGTRQALREGLAELIGQAGISGS